MPTGNGSYMNVTSPTLSAQEGVDSPGATTPYLNPRPRLNLNIGGGLQTPTPPPQPQLSEGSESFSLRPNLSVVYGQGGAAMAAKKPALKLGLQIGKPTPALNLSIPSIQTSRTQSGNNSPSEAYESYYGIIPQPNQQPVAPPTNNSLSTPYTEPFSAETIRPPIATIMPAANGAPTGRENEMVDLQKAIEAIQIREATDPENEDAIRWNNDMFESVRRLGEGAGGAVYQVKQKNTGKMMAMKVRHRGHMGPCAADLLFLDYPCESGNAAASTATRVRIFINVHTSEYHRVLWRFLIVWKCRRVSDIFGVSGPIINSSTYSCCGGRPSHGVLRGRLA